MYDVKNIVVKYGWHFGNGDGCVRLMSRQTEGADRSSRRSTHPPSQLANAQCCTSCCSNAIQVSGESAAPRNQEIYNQEHYIDWCNENKSILTTRI